MNIYQYEDYRHYLKDRFGQERAAPGFSWRLFSARAGISNPGYINDVLKGKRRLSRNALEKLAKYFAFPPHETDFFRLLVTFAHTRSLSAKDRIYRDIVFRRSRSSFAQLNPDLIKYYQDYRYSLVRCALIVLDGNNGDVSKVARFCKPSLPITVVRRIIKELVGWKLVEEGPGGYVVNQKFIEPSPKLLAQMRQVNREWIRQAEEAFMTLDSQDRHIASMLLCVSGPLRNRIRETLERFRNEIWELMRTSTDKPDCIMLLNTQFVPKSRTGARS